MEIFLTFQSVSVFQVHDLCWAATGACYLMHGICLKQRETFFWQSTPRVRVITNTLSRNSSLYESRCYTFDSSAGLRMDGIPAPDLWDLAIEVFHSSPDQLNNTKDQVRGNSSRNTTSNKHTQSQTKVPIQHERCWLRPVEREVLSIWCDAVHLWG